MRGKKRGGRRGGRRGGTLYHTSTGSTTSLTTHNISKRDRMGSVRSTCIGKEREGN